ncbi:hypothetical protein [Streptomyces albireticuli]|uniref:Uncharacterized protein n=1 Tax=Streptomyces albireticuli TaxID=1940 RepID=A0A2A2DBH8_9ACTN|nr:hypothetical protein [Streptomyces albireticuli]MCD9141384.1 hypothetical protein [Streptomyces albireticuli]MCD9160655.1 hypothetical protein [Streptomyces albireticuli]MCD9195789.1 hypothetical protein [Streptomyces albireticuli]PAU48652.1 hypothetical protein CK936_12100 [Streptomyces albireticuli]
MTDDCRGSTPTTGDKADGRGYGLIGLTERVEALGGRLTTVPQGDGGLRVLAVLPLDPDSFVG